MQALKNKFYGSKKESRKKRGAKKVLWQVENKVMKAKQKIAEKQSRKPKSILMI